MEIPTITHGDIHYAELIIEKQDLEIRELQAVIVRLKDEMRIMKETHRKVYYVPADIYEENQK